MTEKDAIEHLSNLGMMKKVYLRLYKDPYKSLYSSKELAKLISMTNKEIERITELMYNMELVDSYDQNTGETISYYAQLTEQEKLGRVYGIKKSRRH